MKHELIMERKPEIVKTAGVKFTVREDSKVQGTLIVSGPRIKWMPKGNASHGFEMNWPEFAQAIEKNGRSF